MKIIVEVEILEHNERMTRVRIINGYGDPELMLREWSYVEVPANLAAQPRKPLVEDQEGRVG